MKHTVIYIGLDLDDTSYHGGALNPESGEMIEFQCRPTLKGLIGQLDKRGAYFPGGILKVCYEASYVGYCLQRDLTAQGVHCDVVAPSLNPKPRGKAIKTDRIDAAELAQHYAKGLLTGVNIPDAEQERDRDLMRSRQYLLHSQTKLRTHLHAVLRRNGLHNNAQTGSKTHWSQQHYDWLERTIEERSGSVQADYRPVSLVV